MAQYRCQTAYSPHTKSVGDGHAAHRQWLDRWAKAFRAHDLDASCRCLRPMSWPTTSCRRSSTSGKKRIEKITPNFLAQYDGPIEVEFREVKIFVGDHVAFAYCLERLNGTLKSGHRSDVWLALLAVSRRSTANGFIFTTTFQCPPTSTAAKQCWISSLRRYA